jgi:hypothetical protein
MSLPKPALPIFSLTVPSTGEKVKFRQFTIREEKMLVQAQSSEDMVTIVNAITSVIQECVTGIKDISQLALFDLEYIMTKIRSKSVGEHVDLSLKCEADPEHPNILVRVDLEKLEVKIPENHSKKVPLYADVGIVMRYPNLGDVADFEDMTPFEAAVKCVDYIYTDEEVFYSKDQTTEEMVQFLESLTHEQFKKIETTFFSTMPSFEHELNYKCGKCGHQHNKVIKGMSNFFV